MIKFIITNVKEMLKNEVDSRSGQAEPKRFDQLLSFLADTDRGYSAKFRRKITIKDYNIVVLHDHVLRML